jgi:hypothetical protein
MAAELAGFAPKRLDHAGAQRRRARALRGRLAVADVAPLQGVLARRLAA